MTKILFIDNGIEFDGDTVRKKPVGGAENAFVSLVEELAKLNFEVVVFNNVRKTNNINGVLWKNTGGLHDHNFKVTTGNRADWAFPFLYSRNGKGRHTGFSKTYKDRKTRNWLAQS